MKVTVTPVIVRTLKTNLNNLEKWMGELKSEEELIMFKPQHCWDWQEYFKESWRFEEICCHSDSSETPPVTISMKNSIGEK